MSFVSSPVVYLVLGGATAIHRELGPGLFESAYQECLAYELRKRGVHFAREVWLPVAYDGHTIAAGYRADFIVDGNIIVDLKSLDRLLPIHDAQILTYLRLSAARQALLINFNVQVLKSGIRSFMGNRRVEVDLPPSGPLEADGHT